jgi:hypothetical protein
VLSPVRGRPHAALPGLLVALWAAGGCADWSYDRVQLGQTPREYESIFDSTAARRTELGICVLQREASGRTDAVVLLLTNDRRIAGKIQSSYQEQNWVLWGERTYRLRGELDPHLYALRSAGPLDSLRAIAGDLVRYEGEKLATDAHDWIAAGLVRLVQRWPNATDTGVPPGRLSELLERVPGGGEAQISVDPAGTYHFAYTFRATGSRVP